jgi:hypothetical protein
MVVSDCRSPMNELKGGEAQSLVIQLMTTIKELSRDRCC